MRGYLPERPAVFVTVCLVVVCLGIGLLLTGCDASQQRTARMSEVWSKGQPLGLASLNNRVALQVDAAGNVYTAWVGLEHELHFVRLDTRAGIVIDRALALQTERPQQPKLALDGEGQLHLTWLDRRERGLQLFHARLSSDGQVLQGATALSAPGDRVAYSVTVLEPVGQTLEVFWSDNVPSQPGLSHVALGWDGTVVDQPEVMVPDGLWPAAQVDRQGFVHLAWQVQPEGETPAFYYAVYDPQRRVLSSPSLVGEPLLRASLLGAPTVGARFVGPAMGLEGSLVYLAWTLEVRQRGELAAFVFYQPFQAPVLGQPGDPGALDYGSLQIRESAVRVSVGNPQLTGDPGFLAGQPAEQVLACYTEAYGPGDMQMLQSAAVYLQEGLIVGQEVVSATPGASLHPAVATDGQGYLHMVWIDTAGFSRYRVIYASTAPAVHEVLDRVTVSEVLDRVFNIGLGAMSLVVLVPFVLLWALPSFAVLIVYYMVSHESELEKRSVVVTLAVAILLQTVVQTWTMAGQADRLLGGLWPEAAPVLGWLIPLFISALAVLAMLFFVRRTGNRSMFSSYLVYAGTNAVLFAAVYLLPVVLDLFGV